MSRQACVETARPRCRPAKGANLTGADKKWAGPHGADNLPLVEIDSYNLELRSAEGFLGDKASKRAFSAILDDWRERVRKVDDDDPLGDKASPDLSKRRLDDILIHGDIEAAGLVQGAIEDFAHELAGVLRRFLRTKGWLDTERIVVGGGFRASRIGELAIGRASVLLKADGIAIDLVPIRHHPDEAGLIGSTQLMPSWTLAGRDALLAIDIGGTNIRTGVVQLNLKKAGDLSAAAVWKSELWRHADSSPDRTETVARIVKTLKRMIERAEHEGLPLAPFIGIGCPWRDRSERSNRSRWPKPAWG